MNDTDMENHPTKSQQKKNEGQRKRSLTGNKVIPRSTAVQWQIWLQGWHGFMFLCVKAFLLTLSKGSTLLHILKIKMHNMSFLYPPYRAFRIHDTRKVSFCGRTPRLVFTSLAATKSSKTDKQLTPNSYSWWACAATPDVRWPSSKNFVR